MQHEQELTKRARGGETVLFLHGIVGTPRHFAPFFPLLPPDAGYRAVLFDGHGGEAADFAAGSMEKWRKQAADAADEILSRQESLFIAAHSMGCLFAIEAALRYPDRVRGLFLMMPPLRIRVRMAAAVRSLQLIYGKNTGDPVLSAMREAGSVRLTKNPFAYLGWIPRYLELFSEAAKVRERAGMLKVPTAVFLAGQDELVSDKSAEYFTASPSVRAERLPRSGHFLYPDEELMRMQTVFSEMLCGNFPQK